MNAKESLLTEIEQIPESLFPEVLKFVQDLKYKHQQEQLETTLLSESSLAIKFPLLLLKIIFC